jgi:hypothetical protein
MQFFQDDRVPMEYGQMLQDIEASMYNLSAASILMKYLYKKRKQELISKLVSMRLGFNRFHSISIVEIIARIKAIVDHLTVRPFNKGRYHVLLPTYNGNWYLLIC